MGGAITAWRLVRSGGQPTHCIISQRDGQWLVMVRHGKEVTLWERCRSDDAALARAQQIWEVLVEHGWSEPRH